MSSCDFFDQVPCFTLRDPLADLLVSANGGLLSLGKRRTLLDRANDNAVFSIKAT